TNSGADQISLSDMAQIRGDLRTGHNDDTVTLSGRAVIAGELCTGRGEDTITLGARTAVEGVVDAGRQDDVIVVETGADVDLIKGGKGFDTLKLGPNTRVELDHNPENGTVFYLGEDGNDTGERVRFRSIENITCFTEGTRIITAQGKRPIESLQVGDAVWTLDAGLQPIAWIGRATVPATGSFAPIRITKDTLGNDRDLLVSAQHRLLLEGWRVEVYCGADEVLAAAKTLVNDTTIRPVEGGDITYIHLAFSDHQIVIAEGIPSESFYPGAQALDALDEATRREVIHLFPEWDCPHLRPQTARQVVRGSEAKILAPTTDCPALRSTD
ncbi:MAG: Hint domain-containing protein, partial [Pseudomonadota bacterium]